MALNYKSQGITICIRQPGLHSILQASFFLVTCSRLETIVAGLIAPADRIQVNVVCKAKKDNRTHINRFEKLKKRIEKIHSLIKGWCKKKLVFASPLLPFGTVGEANTHCTHLQIALADTQTKICKRVQFFPTLDFSAHFNLPQRWKYKYELLAYTVTSRQ